MPSNLPQLRHALLTDVGRKRLANEDAAACDARMNLFVVCDGVGGRPSGEVASHLIAHALPHALRRRLRAVDALDDASLQAMLADAVVTMNRELHVHSQAVPALVGLGCTIVAALIDARTLFHVHAGDSRMYLLRQGELFPLTADHTHIRNKFVPEPETGDLLDLGERRLLMQYLGSAEPVTPSVGSVTLQPRDRILLCTDGLTDPVDDGQLHRHLQEHEAPAQAAAALVEAANAAGGPDNITVAVIDYQGPRPLTDADRQRPPRTPALAPAGVAERTRVALADLEQDLLWLKEGALESAHPHKLTALAAAKRRLGADAYRSFLQLHPQQSPSHTFHQACTDPASAWRQQYQGHLDALAEPLKKIMSGGVRLSAVLSGDETAQIYRELWTGWRRVEQRYFSTCQRPAISATEQTLNILIDHMLASVQTLAALLVFLPRFMREVR